MSKGDQVVIMFGLLASSIVFIAGCVGLALKIQSHITNEFKNHRKLMYAMFVQRDKAIRSLQFWAIQQRSDPAYQPGVDPLELLAADEVIKKNGH